MDFEKWCQGCLIRCFPWIDGKRIYFNVRYFAPGQSICKPPVWDKTIYLVDDEQGRRLAYQFTDTLTDYVIRLPIDGKERTIKVN